MSEIKEEEHSSIDELEKLDALWATFRLPVPIASNGKYYDNDGELSDLDGWLLKALDLARLLHTMNQQYAKPPKGQSRARISRIMNSQMSLAYSMLAKVERTCPAAAPQQEEGMPEIIHESKVDDDAKDPTQPFHPNFHIMLQKLRNDTERTCQSYQLWLDRPPSARKQKTPRERDLIYDIFLAPDSPATSDEEKEDGTPIDGFDDDEEENEQEDNDASSTANPPSSALMGQRHQIQPARKPPAPEAVDPVEFQKQQQELLENELSAMAARLKDSTKAMNVTLHGQVNELNDMEQLAQDNLNQVTDTTKKVEDRTAKKKGWKKRLTTWSLIGTVVGMWVLCFMVMRTVPKRKVGGTNLFGKDGTVRSLWGTCKGYFTKQKKYSPRWGEDVARERERQRQEQIKEQMLKNNMKREREQQQRRQRQGQGQGQQECEVLGDGTQICFDPGEDEAGRMETKTRHMVAERKKRRIEENMANAPAVDAVDSVEVEEADSVKEEQGSRHDTDRDDDLSDDRDKSRENIVPMGCISPTDGMLLHKNALDSLLKRLDGIENALSKSTEGSTQQVQMLSQKGKLRSELKKSSAAFEREKKMAMSGYWSNSDNRVKARDAGRALGSIPFCDGEDGIESSAAEKDAMLEEATKKERREQFKEEARKEEEAQRRAEERFEQERIEEEERGRRQREQARLEAERLAAEETELQHLEQYLLLKQAESERLEREQIEQEQALAEQRKKEEEEQRSTEADRVEQEILTKEAEAMRLDMERIEQEIILAEQAKAEQLEKERLAAEAEAARLEAERLEQERLADAARRQDELERLENERLEQKRIDQEELAKEAKARKKSEIKAKAETMAKEATELATQIAVDNPDFQSADVRFAAGRLKNDLLAHYISAAPEMVDSSDRGGWRPIHEAARAGNLAGVQLLISAGCDLTSRTGRAGLGGTALWWAIQRFGEDEEVVQFLRLNGALEAGPAA